LIYAIKHLLTYLLTYLLNYLLTYLLTSTSLGGTQTCTLGAGVGGNKGR